MLDESRVERLAPAFGVLAGLFWAIAVLGALVRAHGAGLACPDWPLCFGEIVPRFDLRVAFEWSHRAAVGSVSILFVALSMASWRLSQPGDAVRRRVLLAAALLALQILLGALTVWHLLAFWTVTSHLLVGNAIAATLAWTALELRARRASGAALAPATPAQRRVLAAVLGLIVLQLALGGLVSSRYAGLACPEWPTCNGGYWFPSWGGTIGLHLLHRTNGYLLLVALTGLARICRASPRLVRWTRAAEGIAFAQILVGIANVLTGLRVEITGLHSALAATLVLTATGAAQAAFAKPSARGN
jgi:cytochrome c oxidase assembly protein subunit 15